MHEKIKILAFKSSPKKKGNSSILLQHFIKGLDKGKTNLDIINVNELNLKECKGCLKCNLLKKCVLRNDDWPNVSQKILGSDIIIFASPVYFHHFPSSVKKIIDRFRSFIRVRILENGLEHIAWSEWQKHFVLLLSLGSPSTNDANPIIDLFQFIVSEFGSANKLSTVLGTRLAVQGQITMNQEQLQNLYSKMSVPVSLAEKDFKSNQGFLNECIELGELLTQ